MAETTSGMLVQPEFLIERRHIRYEEFTIGDSKELKLVITNKRTNVAIAIVGEVPLKEFFVIMAQAMKARGIIA